jgi:uracil-DNA glycosylase
MSFEAIRRAIIDDADNVALGAQGYLPLYAAGPRARIAVIGQAPGRKAQESNTAWNDASGAKLFEWLGVSESQFRDPDLFALLPMDFYYPGKGTTGDLPPRKNFAGRWHPQLLDLMPDIQLTVLIGSYAQNHYLGARAQRNLTETVRAFRDYLPDLFPVVHPSPLNFRWQARNPWFALELLPVLQRRVAEAIAR